MRKLIAGLMLLTITGCLTTTPQPVFDNLKIARDNIEIQQQIKEDLLNAIDPDGDFSIIEAVTQEKIEMEIRSVRTAEAMNRIINYLSATDTVDYMVTLLKFIQNDQQIQDLYLRWKEGQI